MLNKCHVHLHLEKQTTMVVVMLHQIKKSTDILLCKALDLS